MFEDSTHGGRQNWWLRYPTFLRTSTHALTEGDSFIGNWRCALIISTHALTEGDKDSVAVAADALISTHALTEGDFGVLVLFEVGNIFQLTPSRRATTSFMIYRKKRIHFNSRPHGGRRSMQVLNTATQTFQLTPSRRATMAASIQ